MDDDFDPSLLCPDIAMEVDEAPVITTTDNVPSDGNKSPLLYDPVYSTYVDEMTGAEVTFNLTPEEHQMRQDNYGEKNPIQFTKIHCTACNVHLGSALDGQGNRFVHPLLKVLICKDCYHFYTSGEFEKDEDGSELYCRWCGQGGQVMCCSACEMVFCKKCIRINFGRKKLTEIRDSDDWYCFRCNPIQLTQLRVHCAEFMEYVRREISRAATLENATSFMTTDYTQCCLAQKKKYVDPNMPEQPKKKRKKWVDPDYDPVMDLVDTSKTNNVSPEIKASPSAKVVPILPKPSDPNLNAGVVQVTQTASPGGIFKVGNTTFRPRVSTLSQVRPTLQPGISTGIRLQTSSPGYIKIMPSGIRATTPRQPAQTFVSSSVRAQPFQQRQIRPGTSTSPTMKHEWFEKTVRAAARVNSNLSYTLTQLNRAQATASSVEALAVVHNKLQEILSTSINSLIQIRKNLRTEFIAGIKNIRFPPKPPQPRPLPSTSAQDDDVIFVSPTTSPVPPPLVTSNSLIATNNLTPSVSLLNSPVSSKKNSLPIVPTTTLQPIPSTSSSGGSEEKPKVFLRVKSLSALQNVPSECITIPDDPIPPPTPPPLTAIKHFEDVTMIEDSPEKNGDQTSKENIVNDTVTESEEKKSEAEPSNTEKNCDTTEDVNTKNISDERNEEMTSLTMNDLHSSPGLMKMFKIKVCLQRSEEIDKLVRNKFGLVNGDTSE
ncbi:formin-like protein 7 [Anoplophora glabripennis]|nr:formin-like protein 7 [Anoplophora glabripennis]